MISNKIITFLFYILFCLCSQVAISNGKWVSTYDLYDTYPHLEKMIHLNHLKKMVTKEYGSLKFTVDSTMSIVDREKAVAITKEYIKQCLALINEPEFEDSIHVVLVNDRSDMENLGIEDIAGLAICKEEWIIPKNIVVCVYGNKYTPLKHELMHIVHSTTWGYNINAMYPQWLTEGLATFADPNPGSCDGHTLEERYVYFLQTGKLLEEADLRQFTYNLVKSRIRIGYHQSAYIVGYLYNNYGVEKLKALWQNGTEQFEKIYGLSLEQIIININDELNKKHLVPIEFDWETFCKGCI